MVEKTKKEILDLFKNQRELPLHLKDALLQSLKNGEPSIFGDPNYLCCDLGVDATDSGRYQCITFSDCSALGGSAAPDKSYCPGETNCNTAN